MSKIWKVSGKDLIRGLIVTVLAAIFVIPVNVLAEYIPLLNNPIVLVIVVTIMGYLSKNLATDEEGKLGGKVKIY